MKKILVRYDQWHFTEIDQICLKREAQKLKDIILAKIPTDDPYEIHTKLLPILEACIQGEITKPLEDDNQLISGNYLWAKREGFLPPEYDAQFNSAFNCFAFTVQAMATDEIEKIIKDGVTYAYMEFEEPGDWPDLVLKLEDERRRKRMGADYVPVKH